MISEALLGREPHVSRSPNSSRTCKGWLFRASVVTVVQCLGSDTRWTLKDVVEKLPGIRSETRSFTFLDLKK